MSIFGSIVSKIFGSGEAAAASPTAQSASSTAPSTSGVTSSQQPVDVEAILTDLEAQSAQQLNWRTSIVDLMKLLNLDSRFKRQEGIGGGVKLHR